MTDYYAHACEGLAVAGDLLEQYAPTGAEDHQVMREYAVDALTVAQVAATLGLTQAVTGLRREREREVLQRLHNALFGPDGDGGETTLDEDVTVASYAEHLSVSQRHERVMAAGEALAELHRRLFGPPAAGTKQPPAGILMADLVRRFHWQARDAGAAVARNVAEELYGPDLAVDVRTAGDLVDLVRQMQAQAQVTER